MKEINKKEELLSVYGGCDTRTEDGVSIDCLISTQQAVILALSGGLNSSQLVNFPLLCDNEEIEILLKDDAITKHYYY